jgi:hypothetical protein
MGTQGGSRMGDSGRGPRDGEAYGVAGLTQKLHGISFPISKDDLIKKYGQEKFQWTKGGQSLNLKECLQQLPNQIQSITQITQAVSDAVRTVSQR